MLTWKHAVARRLLAERFARFRRQENNKRFIGDVASFYLPYVEEIIEGEPDIRMVCIKRPREEVVASFCRMLDQTCQLPTNHWAKHPAPGWHHDPLWTRIFPQYDTQNREEGIGRYWDEYYWLAAELATRHSENIRIFDMQETLNTESGLRAMLNFVGIPAEKQVLTVGVRVTTQLRRGAPAPRPLSNDPMDPRRCVVIVPFGSMIIPPCERALQDLERRGYVVRRVGGYAAIDQGRNQMATDALLDGFTETMWIDSDIDFSPDSIDRLRSHNLPIVAGVYPQKGRRALASHAMPGMPRMVFGRDGGLTEMLYVGAGFLHVRREVYLTIQEKLNLPMCNERFKTESPVLPFFHPMVYPCDDGHWYLAEDYAFCERARQCGYKIMADTTIRLWHVGTRAYGWEDAGRELERYDTFTLNFGTQPNGTLASLNGESGVIAEFMRQHPWPAEKPQVPPFPERDWLASGTQTILADSVSPSTRLIVEVGSWTGRSTRYLANLAPRANVIAIDHWQGSTEHLADPQLAKALPQLYETFLSACWDYRNQIIPVRADSSQGLRTVAEAGLQPDLVYIDADHSFEAVFNDVKLALDLFPNAIVAGDDWDWDNVRAAVLAIKTERELPLVCQGTGWKILRSA